MNEAKYVHKIDSRLFFEPLKYRCGINSNGWIGSDQNWNTVTCPECLKLKKDYE